MILDRIRIALAGFRNAQAAVDLAHFLGRFWSVPTRCGAVDFAIDRRALADRPDLGLSENAVRGAIRTLEAAGFIIRAVQAPGSRYKPNAAGTALHRKPILWQFAPAYLPLFLAANARAEAAVRGAVPSARREIGGTSAPRAAAPLIKHPTPASETKAPKWKSSPFTPVYVGDLAERFPTSRMAGPPAASPLEAALARLGDAVVKGDRSP